MDLRSRELRAPVGNGHPEDGLVRFDRHVKTCPGTRGAVKDRVRQHFGEKELRIGDNGFRERVEGRLEQAPALRRCAEIPWERESREGFQGHSPTGIPRSCPE